jgi:hypothetical protein
MSRLRRNGVRGPPVHIERAGNDPNWEKFQQWRIREPSVWISGPSSFDAKSDAGSNGLLQHGKAIHSKAASQSHRFALVAAT